MAASAHARNPRSISSSAIISGVFCIAVAGLAFGIELANRHAKSNLERQQAEWRQRSFDRVKQGDPTAWIVDSKLIPMLANDADCIRITTKLDFTSDIDAADAKSIALLTNVTSMTFYCTAGTEGLLLAAQSLPVTELYFEMPDLSGDDYLVLKHFPDLQKVRFEHVMDDELIERLVSELPSVVVDAPFRRSKEERLAQ